MDLTAKKVKRDCVHLAARSLTLRKESQALIDEIQALCEKGRLLEAHSHLIIEQSKILNSTPPKTR
jgi:hypothetical protein